MRPEVAPSGFIDGWIYVAGGTNGEMPGQTRAGKIDGYLIRYDTDGNLVWARQFGTEAVRKRRPLPFVEVYDPATGRWTADADLATPRGWVSASVVNGRLSVYGDRSLAPEGEILEVPGTFRGMDIYTPAN